MPVVAFYGGTYCRGEEVAEEVAARLGLRVNTDEDLIQRAARLSGTDPEKIRAAMYLKSQSWSRPRKPRFSPIPPLRSALASLLQEGDLVISGLGSQLIPKSVLHVLRVRITAGEEFRLEQAGREEIPRDKALELIRASDEAARNWMEYLYGPGAERIEHHDIVLSLDRRSFEEAVELIAKSARSKPLRPTKASLEAVRNMVLLARIETALAEKGYRFPEFKAEAHRDGFVIEINRKVLRLGRMKKELKEIIREETWDREIEIKVGPGFHRSDIYRQVSFELPRKLLPGDEERDLAEALSERLRLGEVGATVVYDGEHALAAVEEDEPEVMVLDLRLPGVDGTEVLKEIKSRHPLIEVIVLTGRGSSRERKEILELGAFAILQKPVDLEDLTEALRRALIKRRGLGESSPGQDPG